MILNLSKIIPLNRQELMEKNSDLRNICRTHFGWQDVDEGPILEWARKLRRPQLPTPKLVIDQFGLDFAEALLLTKRLFSYSEHHESVFDFVNSLPPGTKVTPFLLSNKHGIVPKVARKFAQKYCGWDPVTLNFTAKA